MWSGCRRPAPAPSARPRARAADGRHRRGHGAAAAALRRSRDPGAAQHPRRCCSTCAPILQFLVGVLIFDEEMSPDVAALVAPVLGWDARRGSSAWSTTTWPRCVPTAPPWPPDRQPPSPPPRKDPTVRAPRRSPGRMLVAPAAAAPAGRHLQFARSRWATAGDTVRHVRGPDALEISACATLLPLIPTPNPHTTRSRMTCKYKCGNACDHPEPNTSGNTHLQDLLGTAVARRRVLGGTAAGSAALVVGALSRPGLAAAATGEARAGVGALTFEPVRAQHARQRRRAGRLRLRRADRVGQHGPGRSARLRRLRPDAAGPGPAVRLQLRLRRPGPGPWQARPLHAGGQPRVHQRGTHVPRLGRLHTPTRIAGSR